MTSQDRKALIAIPFVIAVGAAFAWAGSGGRWFDENGLHPFALSVAIAFILQWIAFVPSFALKTEKFFDLTGALSYVTVALLAYGQSATKDPRATFLLLMVLIWAARLGSFLFIRIHKSGKDGRFDDLKKSLWRFLAAWTLQGLWITFTAAAALAAIGSVNQAPVGALTWLGLAIWIAGFAIEAIADAQKFRFKSDDSNEGKFINEGLWSKSRHPNYFGEIVLWIGVAIVAFPALQGWQYLTLLSPVFVALLLIKVSGIPMLEEKSDQRWGGQPDYEAYKRNTPVLVPKLRS